MKIRIDPEALIEAVAERRAEYAAIAAAHQNPGAQAIVEQWAAAEQHLRAAVEGRRLPGRSGYAEAARYLRAYAREELRVRSSVAEAVALIANNIADRLDAHAKAG